MSKNMKWAGEHLENLLSWAPKETARVYGFSLDYVYTARRRAKQKLKSQERTMPETAPQQEPQGENGRLVRSWEVSAFNRETQEWETTTNRAWDHTPEATELTEDMFLRQAAPVVIRPSRVKPQKRNFTRTHFFGDTQIYYAMHEDSLYPIHDEAAMFCFRGIAKARQPDNLVNLGDTVDFPTVSKYPDSSNRFDAPGLMQKSIDRAHRYWAELGADVPHANKFEVDSNHTIRVDRVAVNSLKQFYGLRRAGEDKEDYPFLTYAWLMNFKAIGVEFTSGYGAAELTLFDDLIAFHGRESRSNGSTAHMESKKNPGLSTVRGHDHRYQVHTTTDRGGNYRYHVVVPALCDIWGKVDGYHSVIDAMGKPVRRSQGWQQGIVEMDRYDDGEMTWTFIPIKDGVAHVDGKRFDGNPEAEEELRRINAKSTTT